MKRLPIIATCFLFILPALAQAQGTWYIGASLGSAYYGSYYNSAYNTFYQELFRAPSSPVVTSVTETNTDTGYDLFGGYSFNSYFALEAHYVNMGTINAYVTFTPPFQPSSTQSYSKFSAESVDAIARYPFNNRWSVFGRAGVVNARFETQMIAIDPCGIFGGIITCGGVSEPVYSSKHTTYEIGAGVNFNMTAHWALSAGYTHYHHVAESGMQPNGGSTPSVDFLYFGATYQF